VTSKKIIKPSFGDSFIFNEIFNEIDEYSIDNQNHGYPVYSIVYKNSKNNDDALNLYRDVNS